MNRPSTSWLPLGSAHAIDWKHLGRPASARGATAWVSMIDGESVLVRAWGEETTSYFDFAFLTDDRVAGSLVISCTRADGNRLRLKSELEIEDVLSLTDISDFRENSRTLLLTHVSRLFELRVGDVEEEHLPPIGAQAAELFEIAPDSAMQTVCADWIVALLKLSRDAVRAEEAPPERVIPPASSSANGKRDGAEARKNDAQPRARTEQPARPANPRATLENEQPPRRVIAAEAGEEKKRPAPESGSRDRAPARGGAPKLTCSTNSGESFEITGDETFIGRSKQCAIVLKSQRVSRKHACVTKEVDGFYINDLGAANGIWAGSEKIDREKIENGDEFIVGDVVLSFSYAG
jgi:hypothetical protein